MADDPFERLSRVAGLTAYILLWFNVCIGLGLRTSLRLPFVKRWRVAALHQFIAVLSLGFLALHIVILVGLSQQSFSFVELWVPSLHSAQATLGIIALYLTVLVVATSCIRRHLNMMQTHGYFVALARSGWHSRARGVCQRCGPISGDRPDGRQCADTSGIVGSGAIRAWAGAAARERDDHG